jgi:hypothetical protein
MTSVRTVHDVAVWDHPPHLGPCGTVVLVPGRGEDPRLYERFGARISADAYRVRVVGNPTRWEEDVAAQVKRLRADEDLPRPFVLAGSDAGALFALGLVAGGVVDVDARLLAGLPAPQPGPAEPPAWDEKLEARTACPTHQGRLSAAEHVERGALYAPLPPEWFDRARLAAVRVPVPALHGAADPVSPLEGARAAYAAGRSAWNTRYWPGASRPAASTVSPPSPATLACPTANRCWTAWPPGC